MSEEMERVSVSIDPATAQTLMDWNVLHFTDAGWSLDLNIWRNAKALSSHPDNVQGDE